MYLKRKRIVSMILVVVLICVFSTAALAHHTYLTHAQNDAIANNWTKYSDYTSTYNCLAYAILDPDHWEWPWGASNPTYSQVTTYMTNKGYSTIYGPPWLPDIIAYGSTSNVTHFSIGNISTSHPSRAKWGSLEVMTSNSMDPYYSSSYGPVVDYFYN